MVSKSADGRAIKKSKGMMPLGVLAAFFGSASDTKTPSMDRNHASPKRV